MYKLQQLGDYKHNAEVTFRLNFPPVSTCKYSIDMYVKQHKDM